MEKGKQSEVVCICRGYVVRLTRLIYVDDEKDGGSLSLGVVGRILRLTRLNCIEALVWGCG